MTVINRALDKAYKRRASSDRAPGFKRSRSASETNSADDSATATVSGWASKLREPIRPLNRPTVSIEAALATTAPAILPAALPEGAIIRVDAGHSVAGHSNAGNSDAGNSDAGHSPVEPPNETISSAETPPAADENLSKPAGPSEPPEQWSWPPIVQSLLTCPAAAKLCDLAAQLRSLAADNDLRCVAFSGPGRKAGRTSLVLTLASVLIADKTTSVAIVDADFDHPHAAELISLQPAEGLDDLISDPATDHETVTTLIDGRLAIVPLVKPIAAETIDHRRIGTLQTFLRSLRREYDLVLIDAGPWETAQMPLVLECRAVDAVVCICQEKLSREESAVAANFRQPGVEWLGVVETFSGRDDDV